jgi:hypothetical protein
VRAAARSGALTLASQTLVQAQRFARSLLARSLARVSRTHMSEYIAHVANRGGLVAIMFADREYPVRAAFSVLQKARKRAARSAPPALLLRCTRTAHCWQAPAADACVRSQLTDDYIEAFGERWRQHTADSEAGDTLATAALTKYQDPAAADKLLQIQRELDETKIVLHKTIDSVLARGEKLDNLVEKSSDLSMASQMFYKQAKKSNSCCGMM